MKYLKKIAVELLDQNIDLNIENEKEILSPEQKKIYADELLKLSDEEFDQEKNKELFSEQEWQEIINLRNQNNQQDNKKDLNIGELEKIGHQMGSNPGGLYRNPNTKEEYYVKEPMTSQHAINEKVTADLYREAQVNVPEIYYITLENGSMGIASKMVSARDQLAHGKQNLVDSSGKILPKGLAEGFAADVWLANWDVIGLSYDNVVVSQDEAYRIDTGGGLIYRAQGSPKGAAFNNVASEWDSLRTMEENTSSSIFRYLTDEQLYYSAMKIVAISDDRIRQIVKDLDNHEEVANILIARKNAIAQKAEQLKSNIIQTKQAANINKKYLKNINY